VRALVIGNRDDRDPGAVGHALERSGYRLRPLIREEPGGWPAPDEEDDLLVVLGSAWSVYWDEVAAVVDGEAAYLRAAQGAGVPILAICYGAQVVATALGGSVGRAPHPEIGWHTVDPAPDSPIDPGPWFQWHFDACTLPPGARLLASSPAGPQAFTVGSTLAVQFHPEIDASIVARWCHESPADLEVVGRTAAELVADVASVEAASTARAEHLVATFLRSVASRPRRPATDRRA
jgi:GMP synthase-like glutamine amidotransferase